MGTRGVPAQYGGFETAAEEIGARLAERGHEVFVYCRNKGQKRREYRGMHLINLPAPRRRELETLGHTALSAVDASRRRFDCILLFNAANAPVLPLLRPPVAIHVDGLEWMRGKWAGRGQRYLKWAERRAVRGADRVIADARGIQDYVEATYGVAADFIPYGAPIVDRNGGTIELPSGLESGQFHLVVARFEPENSVDLILRGYLSSRATRPLLLVGDAPYRSPYREECRRLAAMSESVIHVGSIWDQRLLDNCYAHSLSYLHGHTVGGTNPSLLRAMGAGACVIARDVVFNREVAGASARYFAREEDIPALIEDVEAHPTEARYAGLALRERASAEYRWDAVTDAYESLCVRLVEGRSS